VVQLAGDCREAELLAAVHAANNDPKVHGIIVQLPLPPYVNASRITQAVIVFVVVSFTRFLCGDCPWSTSGTRPQG